MTLTHSSGFRIGAAATTTDGQLGTVCALVIDPRSRVVTHLAVDPIHKHHRARLVPIAMASAEPTAHGIALARAALAGNPSDGYGGAVLAVTLGDYEARAAAQRVEQVVVADLAVTKQRPPERQHLRADECVEGDVDELHGGRVRGDVQFLGGGRDPPGQRDVTQP